jgi:hypothetical protein
MKIALFLFLLANSVSAQVQSMPCGSSPGVASDTIPVVRTSPVAAKAGEPAQAKHPDGNIAAQIRQRRPPPVPSTDSCRCGTVGAGSLTAKSSVQEVPILNGLTGSFRFDHVLVRELKQFSSDTVRSLVVGVGRPNGKGEVLAPFPLKSDDAPGNFSYGRPVQPQRSGAYDLVLQFKGSSMLGDGAVSNFANGTVTWEICGHNVQ